MSLCFLGRGCISKVESSSTKFWGGLLIKGILTDLGLFFFGGGGGVGGGLGKDLT